MAEAIALAASVVAIVQIADHIVGLCKFYIQATQDAPSDLRSILLETAALKAIFENVRLLTAENSNKSSIITVLSDENGPIAGCHRTLAKLEQLLDTELTKP